MAVAVPAAVASGVLSFSVTTPQQHEIIALAPDARSVVASLYQAALYLAISLSGAAGAVGLNLLGARHLSWLAAAFVHTGGGTHLVVRPARSSPQLDNAHDSTNRASTVTASSARWTGSC